MNTLLRAASIAYVVITIVQFQQPTPGVDVWWSLPAKVVLIFIFALPGLAAFPLPWARRRPIIASIVAAMLVGFWLSSAVTFVLIGFSPGHSGTGFMRVLLLLLVLEPILIVCWSVVWSRATAGNRSGAIGSILAVPVVAFLTFALFFQTFAPQPPWYIHRSGSTVKDLVNG